jgi:hypothetical protein
METVTNQFKRFKLGTHASPLVPLDQVHSEARASVSPTAQEPPETPEVSVQLLGQVQELVREFLLSGATGINAPPNQWGKEFQPLEQVTLPTVPTDQAAYYLSRQPQTLRNWASKQEGPIHPTRIRGRLAWPISSLRKVLSGGVQ